MAQTLHGVAFTGMSMLPIDTREYTTTLGIKLCALSQAIVTPFSPYTSIGTITNGYVQILHFGNALILAVPYTFSVT